MVAGDKPDLLTLYLPIGARIDVLIVIGGVVAGVLLVVLLVTIIFCCLVKFCPTTKRYSNH